MAASAGKTKPKSSSLHDRPGHLIRRLHRIMVATFSSVTDAHDISNVQFATLKALDTLAPTTQRNVATYIAMEPSNLHTVLKRLRERRWVDISPDPHDQRRNEIRLTKEGRRVLALIDPLDEKVGPKLLARLNKNERAEFLRLLRKLVMPL